MELLKRENSSTTEKFVIANTGMPKELLLNDPTIYKYPKLDEAVDEFISAVKDGKRIVVYGDYDVDGVTSVSEILLTCRALKLNNIKFLAPRRFTDGYGININRVKDLINEGTEVFVTVDNGIAAIEPVKLAKENGCKFIILDHHEPVLDDDGNIVLPEADVICDPHVTGGDLKYGFDDLCGAGIMLHFCLKLIERINVLSAEEKSLLTDQLYAFAAIGTVADLVKLQWNNRQIVKTGLKAINERRIATGLNKLLEVLGVESVDSSTIGFNIGPAINAMGRLYDDGANEMVQLFSFTEDCQALEDLCLRAKATNEERKAKTKEAVDKALELDFSNDSFIVYKSDAGMPGIAGLVASKLVETFKRPAICFMEIDGILKGSGRTYDSPTHDSIDILSKVNSCKEYLITFGGHPEALGLSIEESNLEAFKNALNNITPKFDEADVAFYDINVKQSKMLWGVVKDFEKYEPFGTGNPKPLVHINFRAGDKMGNIKRTMGADAQHLKLLSDDVSILWFDGAAEYAAIKEPKYLDIIGDLSINEYKGRRSLQIQLMGYDIPDDNEPATTLPDGWC